MLYIQLWINLSKSWTELNTYYLLCPPGSTWEVCNYVCVLKLEFNVSYQY